jgi:hypothetical protein
VALAPLLDRLAERVAGPGGDPRTPGDVPQGARGVRGYEGSPGGDVRAHPGADRDGSGSPLDAR